ncbi:MAG: glycosyltransferase [Dongiaceae bacterium]
MRIAQETRIQAAAGYRTGLLHVPSDAIAQPFVNPEIDACVREGLATVIDPRVGPVRARLLVVHGPEVVFDRMPEPLPRISADRVVVVAGRAPDGLYDVGQKDRLFRLLFAAPVRWAPTGVEVRRALAAGGAAIRLDPEDWRPSVLAAPRRQRRPRWDRPAIGRVSPGNATQWPAEPARLRALYPDDGSAIVRILGLPRAGGWPMVRPPEAWECFDLGEIAIDKFLDSLDFFVYYPGDAAAEVPEAAIAAAMIRGVVTVLPPALAARFASAATACRAVQAPALIGRLHARPAAYATRSRRTESEARRLFGDGVHRRRLARLLRRSGRRPAERERARRILFVSSDGVGLGHVARLLAVARRLPEGVEAVFATMSHGIEAIEGFGYAAEYIPFHAYADCDFATWQGWLKGQFDQIIDFYDVRGVVFDGANPYTGLVQAVAPRPDLRFAWIRRAMWRPEQANDALIGRQRFVDLILEPADIADALDGGATVEHRGRTIRVDPVRLLDAAELLGRRQAAAALGLDAGRPAALLQLGAGSNRDIVTTTDEILKACARFPHLQVVLAEWAMTSTPLDLWPGVRRLRGFPMSRYYNAFDFTIAAAGYNSYHEIISFALPAAFVPNDGPFMDDQGGRALFAEEQGAALYVAEPEPQALDAAVGALMDPRLQRRLRENCRRLARPNGARTAARVIADMICGEGQDDGRRSKAAQRSREIGGARRASAPPHHVVAITASRHDGAGKRPRRSGRGATPGTGAAGRRPTASGAGGPARPDHLAVGSKRPAAVDADAGAGEFRSGAQGAEGAWHRRLRPRPRRARSRGRPDRPAAAE